MSKKIYNQPIVESMSFVGNHALCGSDVVNNSALGGGSGDPLTDPTAD